MTRSIDDDTRFRVMLALEADPKLSQRDLTQSLGISIGIINYCLKGLVEKGQIKISNFRVSNNKIRYAYVLTPPGLLVKEKLTKNFLKRRVAEHEALGAEIEAVRGGLEAAANELRGREYTQ